MRYFVKDNVTQYNLLFGYQTDGSKYWQQLWNYPLFGFGFYYTDLKNPDVLGTSKSMYLYFDKPLLTINKFYLNLYTALGAAYLSNRFDYQTNYTNIAIGTHLNIYANLNLQANYNFKHFIFV